jgi:two-component system LytT family response regulator
MSESAQATHIRTLIVDDEALSRRGLVIRLARAPEFQVIAQAANGREALVAIREHKPDLVFLDIQMPGLSGFDVLKELPATTLPLIVFVTAYDKYAIQAFEARAIDYLLKPVDDARFAAALDHIREHFAQRNAVTHRDRLVGLIAEITGGGESALADVIAGAGGTHAGKHLEMLPIRQGRETVRVEASAIDWIDAAGDYMCVHSEGQTYVLRGTMKDLESALDPRLFQRVHRSTIVNLRRVKRLRAHMNGEYFLTLEGGHELKLSRSYRDKVEYFLKGARLN